MSDGNYNRNLLPYHQYQSGLKAGSARMHTRAESFYRLVRRDGIQRGGTPYTRTTLSATSTVIYLVILLNPTPYR